MQATLFETAKQKGMRLAAEAHNEELQAARMIAVGFGLIQPTVTIDEVQEEFAKRYRPADLGNAAGSVFRGKEWEPCGFRPSTREGNNGRIVRVWKLKRGL